MANNVLYTFLIVTCIMLEFFVLLLMYVDLDTYI